MRVTASSLALVVLLVCGAMLPGIAGAADRIESLPPFYATGLGHTSETDPGWVIGAFYRAPECVPDSVDPVNDMVFDIDPDCPTFVEGFFVIEPGSRVPIQSLVRNAPGKRVPIWFVGVGDYAEARADGRATQGELKSLDSLIVGWADSFLQVRQPVDASDPMAEYQQITEAAGYMEDGRSFRVRSVVTKVGGEDKAYNVSVRFGD